MKKLLFLGLLLGFTLPISQLSAQVIGGVLVDEDDKALENKIIDLKVFVCKNGDSLFTKSETVTTKDFGIFSTDLTEDFKMHPVSNKDTISYQLMYVYIGDTIMTEKKEWSNVRFANQADKAALADHANTSDVSTATESYPALDNASINGGGLLVANPGRIDAYGVIPAPPGNNEEEFFFIIQDENNQLKLDQSELFSGLKESFDQVPPTGDPFVWTITNNGTENRFEVQHHWTTDVPEMAGVYNAERKENGDIGFKRDQFHDAIQNSPPGLRDIIMIENPATGELVFNMMDPLVSTDGSGNTTMPPPVEIMATDGTTVSLVPNPSYSAMGNAAACFKFFFETGKSPLLDDINGNKSNSYLEHNNALWENYKNNSKGVFEQNIEKFHPELVRYINNEHIEENRAVNYTALIPLMSKAIKEQNDIIDAQQKQINELKELVHTLIETSNK